MSTSTKQSVATRRLIRRSRTGIATEGSGKQCRPLLTLETITRALERGAVNALVCVDEPALEMRLERREASEREPSNRILLYVADTRLGLAFRASAIRATRSHVDAPVFAERRKRRVHTDGATTAFRTVS